MARYMKVDGDLIPIGPGPTEVDADTVTGVASEAYVDSVADSLSPTTSLVYKPQNLSRWATAYADVATTQASIVCIGNSVTEGANANDSDTLDYPLFRERGWVGQLRRRFAQDWGHVGEGGIWMGDSQSSRIALSGSTLQTGSGGVGIFGKYILHTLTTHVTTLTLPPCSSVRIHAWRVEGFSVPFEYQVDGGAWVATADGPGSDTLYFRDIDGLDPAEGHTVAIRPTEDGNVYLLFVEARLSTSRGVKVTRFGESGKVMKDAFALFDTDSASTQRQVRSATEQIGADLVVFDFSATNVTGGFTTHGLSPSDVATGTKQVTDYLTSLGMSVLLLGGPPRDPDTVESTSDQAAYDDAVKALADTDDHVSFLDLTGALASHASGTDAGLIFDAVHPTRQGHELIAGVIHDALTSRIG